MQPPYHLVSAGHRQCGEGLGATATKPSSPRDMGAVGAVRSDGRLSARSPCRSNGRAGPRAWSRAVLPDLEGLLRRVWASGNEGLRPCVSSRGHLGSRSPGGRTRAPRGDLHR